MTRHSRIPSLCLLLAASLGLAGAASAQDVASLDLSRLQTIDTTPLSIRSVDAMPAAGLVMQAHAQALRPAPLPDPDVDAPGPDAATLAAQRQTSVQPGFYAINRPFAGNGFAAGSTLDGDAVNRARPRGGMSLSIPMP